MGDRYVSIGIVSGALEGEIVRSYLESLEIPCVLSGESVSQVYGFGVGPLAEVEIFVPARLEEEGRQALEAYWQSRDEPEDEAGDEAGDSE